MKLMQPMPECWYQVNQNTSYEELSRKQSSNEFVVGKVFRWCEAENYFKVDLGNNYIATLPIEEASIYPTQFPDGKLSGEAFSIIGQNICAKIKTLSPDNIILSRKANMEEAFEYIYDLLDCTVNCSIKTIKETTIFIDVGHGISGMIHVTEFSSSRVKNIKYLGCKEGDSINMKIKSIDKEKFHITLGYKELYENISDKFDYHEFVEVIALNPVQNTPNACFCWVNPNTSAIMNFPPYVNIPYGSKILARVRASKPQKLKLSYVAFTD